MGWLAAYLPHGLRFGRFVPTVSAADIDRSQRFYCGALGFDKSFVSGDSVCFVILERDAAELHLALNTAHQATYENLARLMVSDAGTLHGHRVASGLRIVKALRDADYGLGTFVLADLDGN